MATILKIDEVHALSDLYDYTDRVIKYLARKNRAIFDEHLLRLSYAKDKDIIKESKEMYDELTDVAVAVYLKLANYVLKKYGGEPVNEDWILDYLYAVNGTTLYSFIKEVERKRGRFEERMIATRDRTDDNYKGLRDWSKMVNQYSIGITDEALHKVYEDTGVTIVKWVSVKDTRCCDECEELDGNLFPLKEVPPKPHWGCRCRLVVHEYE